MCRGCQDPGLSLAPAPAGWPKVLEVAGMAATTASSRGIAARLVLSVWTVDNHLQNGSSKLGVTSRNELAGLLRSETGN